MTLMGAGRIGILGVLATSLLGAENFSHYRGLEFGMNVAAASKVEGTNPSQVNMVHQIDDRHR